MAFITDDLNAFSTALKHSFVVCTSDGKWTEISKTIQRCHCLIGVDDRRLVKIAKVFSECLDRLESIPARINCSESSQALDFHTYLKTAEVLQDVLAASESQKVKKSLRHLKGRVIALQARVGLDAKSVAATDTIEKVERLAEKWKRSSHLTNDESLNENDLRRIRQAYENKGFAELLVEDSVLRKEFFHWILRDRVDPDPFIQFPAICKRLTGARLSHRIGFYGGDGLKISERKCGKGAVEKVLTLPIAGREISVLNDQLEVELEEGYKQTIGNIIKVFKDREREIGNLEYFKEGIRSWNPKRLGSYHPEKGDYQKVSLDDENWWEALPVVEELAYEEAGKRYGQSLNGTQWVMALRGAREQENDSPFGIHGWMQLAIPIEGVYRVYDFGKYSEEFPKAWYDKIFLVTDTVPAVITYPDEALFASDRQHGWHTALATPEEGFALMNALKKDFENVEAKNLPFQFLSENCVKWAWTRINAQVGNEKMPRRVVKADFTSLSPSGGMGMLFKFLSALPFALRWTVLTLLVCLLGAWRSMSLRNEHGKISKVSLLKNLPWSKGQHFFHPGQVFRRH